MPIKMTDVRGHLELDEPDYAAAAEIGVDALPHLQTLVNGNDVILASKATYLASLIKDRGAADVLRQAATHTDPVVRVAAAAAVKNLAVEEVDTVIVPLLADGDVGVRKVAIKSIPDSRSHSLTDTIQSAAADEADPELRVLYRDALSQIGGADSGPGAGMPTGETVTSETALVAGEVEDSGENGGAGMGGVVVSMMASLSQATRLTRRATAMASAWEAGSSMIVTRSSARRPTTRTGPAEEMDR